MLKLLLGLFALLIYCHSFGQILSTQSLVDDSIKAPPIDYRLYFNKDNHKDSELLQRQFAVHKTIELSDFDLKRLSIKGNQYTKHPIDLLVNDVNINEDTLHLSYLLRGNTLHNIDTVVFQIRLINENNKNDELVIIEQEMRLINLGEESINKMTVVLPQEWKQKTSILQISIIENKHHIVKTIKKSIPKTTKVINVDELFDELIYPNPTSNYINLKNEDYLIEKIEIYSIIGSLIHTEEMTAKSSARIAVFDFEEGSYLLRIYDINKQVYTGRIVVEF